MKVNKSEKILYFYFKLIVEHEVTAQHLISFLNSNKNDISRYKQTINQIIKKYNYEKELGQIIYDYKIKKYVIKK